MTKRPSLAVVPRQLFINIDRSSIVKSIHLPLSAQQKYTVSSYTCIYPCLYIFPSPIIITISKSHNAKLKPTRLLIQPPYSENHVNQTINPLSIYLSFLQSPYAYALAQLQYTCMCFPSPSLSPHHHFYFRIRIRISNK